jgi:hypothetical protein
MKVLFGDPYSCGGSWYGNVVIKDSVKTDTVQIPDTIAVVPLPDEIDTSGHITIYPMPATGDYITINGRRPSETDCHLRITDMKVAEIIVPGISMNNTSLTVPGGNIPAGLYIVMLRTPERIARMKLQVLK